jgi:hypothetical protein
MGGGAIASIALPPYYATERNNFFHNLTHIKFKKPSLRLIS